MTRLPAYKLNDPTSIEHRLTLLFILALGIALRVYAWYVGEGYLYYAINDEMLAYRYALGFLAGEEHTLYLAQPAFASGQAPGPLWTLLWVILLKLGNDSVHYALLWMTLFNSIAIYLFYRLARHFVTPPLTLLATLYFALSPWTIYYSTGMWNPLPLMVIGGVLFLSLWHVLNNNCSRQIFWVCLFTAIVPQFHMIGVFYMPVILFLLVISNKSINKSWLILGVFAGIAIYIPYFIGEWNHGFENTRNMLTGTADHSYGVVKVLSAPLTMITSIPAGWAGRSISETIAYADEWFGSIYVLLVFTMFTLAYGFTAYFHFFKQTFILYKQTWKTPRSALSRFPQQYFLSSLILLPLLLFVFTRHSYATRYTILIFPLLFLLPVLFYRSLEKSAQQKIFVLSTACVLLFNIYLVITFFSHQGDIINHSTNFSPSFKSMDRLARDLHHAVGPGKRIKIILSKNIQALPEGKRKVAVAVTDYFKVLNVYVLDKHSPTHYITLEMELSSEITEAGKDKNVIHQSNGMAYRILDQD